MLTYYSQMTLHKHTQQPLLLKTLAIVDNNSGMQRLIDKGYQNKKWYLKIPLLMHQFSSEYL
jgi:hypothetical protein